MFNGMRPKLIPAVCECPSPIYISPLYRVGAGSILLAIFKFLVKINIQILKTNVFRLWVCFLMMMMMSTKILLLIFGETKIILAEYTFFVGFKENSLR